MNVIRVKSGVQFGVIAPAGFAILAALHQLANFHAVDFAITSGTDSHTLPDPHAKGEAYDVSVAGFAPDAVVTLHSSLQQALGPLFTVLYEVPHAPTDGALTKIAYVNPRATAPHFHVQVKNGVVFPPPPPASSTTVRA